MDAKKKKRSIRRTLKNILLAIPLHVELIFVSVIVLFPVVWIVGSSFGSSPSLAQAKAIPDSPTVQNYLNLFKNTDYLKWYKNTLFVSVVTMFCSVFLTTLTSYAFARFNFRGKKAGLMSILVLQMFPTFLGMTALYVLIQNFNLLDNLWGLALIYIAGQLPYNTWMMKGYLRNIPMSLDEAAMLDGASRLTIFYRIIFPLAFPMITFLAVSTFMMPWMDYLLPRLLIRTDANKTLAIGLFDLINNETNKNFTMFAAGAVLVAVPITALYLALQKFLIQGISAGANKE